MPDDLRRPEVWAAIEAQTEGYTGTVVLHVRAGEVLKAEKRLEERLNLPPAASIAPPAPPPARMDPSYSPLRYSRT